MNYMFRKVVSKEKRRYQKNGFDLDLSYITQRIIAMGFPSESVEGVYRNPFKEVFRFLEQEHKDHYKVYNLCSERSYDISKFHNRVECFPFDDHNSPPLDLIFKFCISAKAWLDAHESNVAVVHCKAGKGRTGVMICALLLYNKEWKTATEALNFYAAMRTHNLKGVTIPSQIRYVQYVGEVVYNQKGELPDFPTLLLESIELQHPPKGNSIFDVRFSIYLAKVLIYASKNPPKVPKRKPKSRSTIHLPTNDSSPNVNDTADDHSVEDSLLFELVPLPIHGDVKLDFYEKETFGSARVFAFWFNTAFVKGVGSDGRLSLELSKSEIDKANKDKSCKVFPENFKVICHFLPYGNAITPGKNSSSLASSAPVAIKLSNPVIVREEQDEAALLSMEEKTGILNHRGKCTRTSDSSCMEISIELLRRMITLMLNSGDYNNNKNSSTSSSDDRDRNSAAQSIKISGNVLETIRKSKQFKEIALSTCELQKISLESMESDAEKLSFWINIFNLLSIHYCIHCKSIPTTFEEKLKSFRNAKYEINDRLFSLLDIEFGILRAKMVIPEQIVSLIEKDDSKTMAFSLQAPEPRLNFALSYGTKSSPAVRIYHSLIIYDQLEKATRSFFAEYVIVDCKSNRVILPKVLDWFGKDFGKNTTQVIKSLVEYFPRDRRPNIKAALVVETEGYDGSLGFSFCGSFHNISN